MASCAQRLLEHSLLTELQGVVARTLQGVDMFSQTQLAGILGHSHCLQDAQPESSEAQTQVLLTHRRACTQVCLNVLQAVVAPGLH